jgi:glycosyltransferase involved in cell wall biosynthesis
MKIALVHDHLLEFGGAERVLVALKKTFPDADVFIAAYDLNVVRERIPDFSQWRVHTSWAARIPFFRKIYSPLRFLAPHIWESFDFSDYDIVISSSGWFMSKGIKTDRSKTKHYSYIHHPPGYLYGYQTAVEWQRHWPIKIYATIINHFLRIWDFKASQRPDILIANSQETRKRIQKFYRRDAEVIYPPVDIPKNEPVYELQAEPYFITVSRLAYKKHVDIIIKAANKYGFQLKVVGKGRDEEVLRELAGPTVEILGYVPDKDFQKLFAGARAFLNMAVEEEFGISPVEAMGRGVPVIAYASGGLIETVKDGKNGFLVAEHTPEALYKGVQRLEKLSEKNYLLMRKQARKDSQRYTFDVFAKQIKDLIRTE